MFNEYAHTKNGASIQIHSKCGEMVYFCLYRSENVCECDSVSYDMIIVSPIECKTNTQQRHNQMNEQEKGIKMFFFFAFSL